MATDRGGLINERLHEGFGKGVTYMNTEDNKNAPDDV